MESSNNQPRIILCSRTNSPAEFKLLKRHSVKPTADGIIYWHIVNFTEDQDRFKTVLAFTQAFDAWQGAMDMVQPAGRFIQFKSTNDFNQAHIKLFFVKPGVPNQLITKADGSIMQFTHKWPFDGNGGILAHVPPDCCDIYFDEGENWGEMFRWDGDTFYAPLMPTAMHEIGHSLDLDHSTMIMDIMYGSSDGKVRVITPDAVQGLTAAGWGKKKAAIEAMATTSQVEAIAPAPEGAHIIMKALQYYGIKEAAGAGNNKDIITMIKGMFPEAVNDGDVPWCAIFMNFILSGLGIKGTGSGLARSFLKWGQPVAFADRQPGDIAVFWRGTPESGSGHVAIYINDKDVEGKYIRVLGGNQADSVNIQAYPKERLLQFRRNG